MRPVHPVAAILLCVAACSSPPADTAERTAAAANESAPNGTAPVSEASAPSVPAEAGPAATLLTLEGLGRLRIGEAVPAEGGWAERGAQASDTCRTISSPDYPGIYAIVEGARVRRITLGERSRVRLLDGIAVGSSEADVRAAFPGFRETPHAYVEAPGKYLTAPGAEGGASALRFEIGRDGRVSLIHVGTMPVLGYVEGCA